MNNIESVIEFFRTQPIVTLFLVLGLGHIVGRLRLAGVTLGALGGMLIISLVLGRYGFRITEAAQSIGFALFMFGLGYQAGPQFVQVLKTQGLRYLALSIVVAGIGYFVTVFAGRLLDLPTGGAAGLFAGALTATPALAAAQEAVRSGIAAIPEGTDSRRGDHQHRYELRDYVHRRHARDDRRRASLAACRGHRSRARGAEDGSRIEAR